MASVLGAVIIVVILLVVIPVGVLMTGGVAAGLIGSFLKADADAHGEDTWKQLNY